MLTELSNKYKQGDIPNHQMVGKEAKKIMCEKFWNDFCASNSLLPGRSYGDFSPLGSIDLSISPQL